ncbi:hypothetical protein N9Y42_07780 [Mariniblastus sp.]|nr:hypothetical protein [Mariniblastus sp.]
MSYDLVVFEPESRFENRIQFTRWYQTQTKWEEGNDYRNAENATPNLKAWLLDIIQQFPERDDYSICSTLIYFCFSWPQADKAHRIAFSFAQEHSVGFYDVSSESGQVWMPNSKGKLSLVHSDSGDSKKFWTEAPPCPQCGKQLITKLSKQCLQCGADWH